MKCHYCGRAYTLPCQNTRDMTDYAIANDDGCLAALEKLGWGENGEQYVRLNREKWNRDKEEILGRANKRWPPGKGIE